MENMSRSGASASSILWSRKGADKIQGNLIPPHHFNLKIIFPIPPSQN